MMSAMRTTLTLDDDLAAKLRQFAHRRRISFKQAVNSVLRDGFAVDEQGAARQGPFRIAPFDSPFKPGVDPLRLNQLLDDLDVERGATQRAVTGRRGTSRR